MNGKQQIRWVVAIAIAVVGSVAATASPIHVANAAPTVEAGAPFVPVTACRLVDTRAGAFHVGGLATFGPGETQVVAPMVHGGECEDGTVPAGASAVVLNVTAIGATAPTFS